MERIKKNFGFGFMRLPIRDGEVDIAETNRMVDAFLDAGFNYFDTAHGYLHIRRADTGGDHGGDHRRGDPRGRSEG